MLDVGINIVELIGTDNSGNTSSSGSSCDSRKWTIVNIMLQRRVLDHNAWMALQAFDITVDGSDVGVEYFLINTVDNAVIDGPIAGTGSP